MAKRTRFIDLGVPIKNPEPGEMDDKMVEAVGSIVTYEDHEMGTVAMEGIFGCTAKDLPQGLGWGNEHVRLSTHSGTHFDAPYHYHPTAEGRRAITVDEVPLEWCYADGVVLDMRHKKRDETVTVDDMEEAIKKIGYQIKPFDIALMMFGTDKLFGKPEYWYDFAGMSRESTLWLLEKGVKVTGTDTMSWDRNFYSTAEEFKRTGRSELVWEAHYAGITKEYCHMEKLANLDKLPPSGFKVICFPVSIYKATAAWVRPVALVEEEE